MKHGWILALIFTFASAACAASRTSTFTITAPAKFEERDAKYRYLIVSDATHSFDILWSALGYKTEVKFFPFTLKASEVYTFTIEETRSKFGEEFGIELPKNTNPDLNYVKIPRIIRVVRDGSVLFDREICEVHHAKMERREVPIIYGLIKPQGKQPSEKQCRTQFPHYTEQAFGGCCVMSKKMDFIYVCPNCVAAHKKWEEDAGPTTR